MKAKIKGIFFGSDLITAIVLVVGSLIIWGVCKLTPLVYEKWNDLLSFATAVATVGAAVATWRAAQKAAESAQIARESMDATMTLGRQTLEETRLTNKRTAFETRYAMLLAQHDQYHRQLCDYLDTGKISPEEYRDSKVTPAGQKDIYRFFKESVNVPSPDDCFSFLTGHEIISRYMRTLYHLLKFVDKDCTFIEDDRLAFQRKYTSPVRSTIRNDVLLLIAVNALNVDDPRAKESSYPYYQELLHEFDFFEHAVFMFPYSPNELFKSKEWVANIQNHVLNKQSDFIKYLDRNVRSESKNFTIPDVRLFSPLIMTLIIFKNPMRVATLTALKTLSENQAMKYRLRKDVENGLVLFGKARAQLEMISQGQMKPAVDAPWEPVDKSTLTAMQLDAFKEYTCYKGYLFRENPSEKAEIKSGGLVLDDFKYVRRYEKLASDVDKYGGVNEYMHHNTQILADRLEAFNEDIKKNNIRASERTSQKDSENV